MYQFDEVRPTPHLLHDIAKGNIWDSQPFKIDEKTDFHFECKSSSSTNEVSLFVEAILVRNS